MRASMSRAAGSLESAAAVRLPILLMAAFALALPPALAAERSAAPPAPDDWPWWRGPGLDNVAASDQDPPVAWGEAENVLWRVRLPGSGHATPCIRGGRIFVPAADAEQREIWMLCLDRATGRTLWRTRVHRGDFPKIHEDNSPASATAACDGARIYFAYQSVRAVNAVALDLAGKVLWNREVGPFESVQGYSASPALHGSLLIVPVDGSLGQSLYAVRCEDGEAAWKAPLPEGRESYASPLVVRVAGRDQAVIIGGIKTSSYDPATGGLLWRCDGPAEFCAATIAFGKDVVYATGGYPEKGLLAIRADGAGDVTATHLAWKSDKKAGYVPSPLLHEGLLYAVSDNGLMRCYDAADGRLIWQHELKAPFYSSPVLAAGRIYVFDRKGKGYVMKAGRTFELLGASELPDGVFATPVIAGSRIYLRTLGDFYCLGAAR
jgi:hypothetical protein